MKRIQKILAVLLSMAMVFGMTSAVFAAVPTVSGKSSDQGIISVSGIESGKVVKAYQIVSANYTAEGGGFSGYAALPGTGLTVDNSKNLNDKFTNSELSAVLKKLQANPVELTLPVETMNEGEAGTYSLTVTPGAYLIVVESEGTTIYNPMVATLYYQNVDGQNTLVADNPTAKVSDAPVVDKTIVSSDGTTDGNTANVGDVISYQVEINPIPYYGGAHPTFVVQDTLDEGLAYQADPGVVVKVEGETEPLTAGTDYTLTAPANGQSINIDFVVNGQYTLNEYAAKKMTITYSAKLTDSAVYNQNADKNNVTVTFARNSNITGNDGTTSDNTNTYTFDLSGSMNGLFTYGFIKKVDGDGVTEETTESELKGLPGAQFTLYNEDGTEYENEAMDNPITTVEGGWFTIKGLAQGKYYLKETVAPDGFSLNDREIPIEITASFDDNDELESFTVKVDGKEGVFSVTANGEVKNLTTDATTVPILNTHLTSLPSTGGIGTTIFTIGGCIIMIAAAGLFFASRRKSAK